MKSLKGQVVVTGGSRGIGRAFVVEAAKRGHNVVFSHRGRGTDAAETVALSTRPDVTVTPIEADLTDPVDVERFAEAAGDLGETQMLINCAGFADAARLDEVTERNWNDSFAVHVESPMRLVRAFAVSLAATQGAVLNVASDAGVIGSLFGVSYGSSKAATIGLSKSLARELAPQIRVNTLAPGPVATDMWDELPEGERRHVESTTPLGRVGRPAEIAEAGLDMCDWTFATGQTFILDGGRTMQ